VDVEIERGETKSLIGPNGAGKTTFLNCLTGTYEVSAGEIYFDDHEITHVATHERVRMGMGRSYQKSNLFDDFTVFENVRLAKQVQQGDLYDMLSHYLSDEGAQEAAMDILEQIELDERRDVLAEELSHGEKRQLELAMVLVQDPDLLLLDEPTAGIATERINEIIQIVKDIKGDYGILLIEHNLDVVMSVSDSIMVLDQGEKIADGDPDTIREDEAVREAYLGTEVADLGG
jgi:branched-chain amino acid transport system ATP-binding protein